MFERTKVPQKFKEANVIKAQSGRHYGLMQTLGRGSFGIVIDAVEVVRDVCGNQFVPCKRHHDGERSEVVVKGMTDCPENENEVNLLRKFERRNMFGFAKLLDLGEFEQQSQLYAKNYRKFIIMEKLGKSLKDFYLNIQDSLRLPDIIKIGIELIERVRKLHQAGFIHGDIKPDNIVFGDYNGPMNELIDSQNFDKTGEQLAQH